MTDTDGGASAPEGIALNPTGPQIAVAAQYVKDFSFENPNAPQSLASVTAGPKIDVNIDVEARAVAPPQYETLLRINLKAHKDEQTLFVIELVYGGTFTLQNIPEDNLEAICLIECPRFLFPFARRIIADAARDGGFPPVMIDPIDFGSLFRQRKAQAAAAATGNGGAADPMAQI